MGKALLEELVHPDPRIFSSDDDPNGTSDLAVGEVTALESSGNKDGDTVQGTTALTVPSAMSVTAFTWENMKNYVQQRELLVTVGLKMKHKMKHFAKVFSTDKYMFQLYLMMMMTTTTTTTTIYGRNT
jgi:hypothetical protein